MLSLARKLTIFQFLVRCAAAHHIRVCAIYPVWQLPVVHPVIDGACTLVSPHFFPISTMFGGYHFTSVIYSFYLHHNNAVVKDDGGAVSLT